MTGRDGNNRTVRDAAWKVVTGATLVGVLGVASMLWGMNARLAVMEAQMVTEVNLLETLNENVPSKEKVDRISEDLEEHIRETAQQAHRGGSGG